MSGITHDREGFPFGQEDRQAEKKKEDSQVFFRVHETSGPGKNVNSQAVSKKRGE